MTSNPCFKLSSLIIMVLNTNGNNNGGSTRTSNFGAWARYVSITPPRLRLLCINNFFLLINPNTNYTFPCNYLVTTSFQLKTHRRGHCKTYCIADKSSQRAWSKPSSRPWRAVCTELQYLFTATCLICDYWWFRLYASSNCRRRSVLRKRLFNSADIAL